MKDKKIELTDIQKLTILQEWNNDLENPPSIEELRKAMFGEKTWESRFQTRAIREFLATKDLTPRDSQKYIPKDKVVLTPEHKEFIANNCSSMKLLEMTRTLFNNQSLSILSQEGRAVTEYARSLPNVVLFSGEEKIVEGDYKPPKRVDQICAKINQYVHSSNLKEETLKPHERKCALALIGYLHVFRFKNQIDTYNSDNDRSLFESEFIRCCYDKPDLSEEEVDQYIIYANEVVMDLSTLKRIEQFKIRLDEDLEGDKRLSKSLVDSIKSMTEEHNMSISRQNSLLNDLKGKRKERISLLIKENSSLVQLIEVWKNEEQRKQIVGLAKLRKEKIKEEINRMTNMDEMRLQIWGVSPNEILNS